MSTDPIAERFQRETADHEMTVLHDDGLYRHLRFAQPGPHSWHCRFDLVTWPGTLTITGDCGTYVFQRLEDMFEFFRQPRGRAINPGYWGEKTPGGTRSVKAYSEDLFKQLLEQRLTEYEKDEFQDLVTAREQGAHIVAPMLPEEVRDLVKDYDDDGRLSFEDGARELLGALEQHRIVSETYEWDLHDYEWSFLWCCHAIVSGIAMYDASSAAATA